MSAPRKTGFCSWTNSVAYRLRALKETVDYIGGCSRRRRRSSVRVNDYEVWAFRGAECDNCCILRWDAVWSGRGLQIFHSKLCPHCEGRTLSLVVKDVVPVQEHMKCCSFIKNKRQTCNQDHMLTVRTRTPLERRGTFIILSQCFSLNTKTVTPLLSWCCLCVRPLKILKYFTDF